MATAKKTTTKTKRTPNAWQIHVKATMKLHPDKKFSEVLKLAKKTYTK